MKKHFAVAVAVVSFIVTQASVAQEVPQPATPTPAAPGTPASPAAAPAPVEPMPALGTNPATPSPRYEPAPLPPVAAAPSLRKRQHNLTFEYSTTSTETEVTQFNGTIVKSDSTTARLSVSYGYEFGYLQPYVSASSLVEKTDTSDYRSGTFALGLRASFVENRPGNDVIPFVFGNIAGLSAESSSGSTTVNIYGRGVELGVGLDWYPVGEIMALRFSLSGGGLSGEASNGTTTLDHRISAGNLSVGYVFSY